MSDIIYDTRKRITEIGALMYQRFLTDSAGGNISVRIGDTVLMTPRYAGSKWFWKLDPEQVLILDLEGNKVEGDGEVSREFRVHIKLLNDFYPDGTVVVHGHARNVLVFCALNLPLPSMLYSTDKFGEIVQVEDAPAHTPALSLSIAAAIKPQLERVKKQAAVVNAPRHGTFVFAKDLESGYDALERVDVNAYMVMMSKHLR